MIAKSDSKKIVQMIEEGSGFWTSSILIAANQLDIFDALSLKKTAQEVAKKINGKLRGTEILLNALTAMGYIKKVNEFYMNTPFSEKYLVKGKETYMGSALGHYYQMWKDWGNLVDIVKNGSGDIQFEKKFLETDANQTEVFIDTMYQLGQQDSVTLASKLDLKGVKRVLDVGGGPGHYSFAMIEKNPQIRATVLDLPLTLRVTKKYIKKRNMTGKVDTIEGDFTKDDYRKGYDLILLSHVLHSNSLKDCQKMINKSYRALNGGGRIVIHEFVLNDDKFTPPDAAIFSVNMLVNTKEGASYSISEITSLLKSAGFKNFRHGRVTERSGFVVGYKE
ncbi:MAG: hypothetical protein A3C43_08110 [Candidatus Schekmanbacteria bacterium RIFCSPHIGHO2_02_FULL_38_11]|uniref:Methyltransferase n=1 Tax=Candidatus Schekmanbacteria bacterium RIFCSPLOWO2_12_FULL_38_15 TaxID=1817883 RepID=A0A1F7SKF7_9BACT|nr:MAG: hypothetical protein A3H37_04965 [Candidatus Schekmanbacteria bacterium RIFCSPLOWO2_02_FULL_38_14]OGL51860.1 MAG: hypothetical protein A3C43_08110 [Candidatus Schekmanbacteria bacterium RIFCSPHIGHO2_02_FULL_38_11]OGL54266.1 MAG: hypothetical protein A3G31_04005 [Candidatus Schekmanbacteria bacterium RIFCSPLOWO2_12_FULL_38_15]